MPPPLALELGTSMGSRWSGHPSLLNTGWSKNCPLCSFLHLPGLRCFYPHMGMVAAVSWRIGFAERLVSLTALTAPSALEILSHGVNQEVISRN